ncbi:Meningioma expressed antigen 5 (Hyaluronidase), partial [Cichlidogyrus casuarinus]
YSQGYLEMVTSGQHEPWKFRGGIVTELHRILPLDSSQELFPAFNRAAPNMIVQGGSIVSTGNNLAPQPEPMYGLVDVSYVVRLYTDSDRSQTFDLCQRKLLSRLKISDSFPDELRDLPGNRYLAGYLEHSPQHCFVIEKLCPQRQIVGYALAAPEVVAWARDLHSKCLVRFWNQYKDHMPKEKPKPKEAELSLGEVTKRLIRWFYKTPEQVDNPTEEEGVASSLVEMAIITPPPHPLGASVPDEELASTVTGLQPETETSISSLPMDTWSDTDLQKESDEVKTSDLVQSRKLDKNALSPGSCPPEAIYATLASHPASLVMEIDDLIAEPNELEDVTQRLLICLLSSLKMVAVQGVHTELDDLNETRVDFFRHFGFYPVPITSFDRSTILARMI